VEKKGKEKKRPEKNPDFRAPTTLGKSPRKKVKRSQVPHKWVFVAKAGGPNEGRLWGEVRSDTRPVPVRRRGRRGDFQPLIYRSGDLNWVSKNDRAPPWKGRG